MSDFSKSQVSKRPTTTRKISAGGDPDPEESILSKGFKEDLEKLEKAQKKRSEGYVPVKVEIL